ncbi:hypothetical protein FRC09_011278 [Ceratobasidium sp. 395]|nr:hypothetical protein FRC09_011278 [Ceratobasidium sp. 395]
MALSRDSAPSRGNPPGLTLITEPSHNSQPQTVLPSSTNLPSDLLETTDTSNNKGKTLTFRANETRISLSPSTSRYMLGPTTEDTETGEQLKETDESIVPVGEPPSEDLQKVFRLGVGEPVVAAKRKIDDIQTERSRPEGDKRAKVAYMGAEGLDVSLTLEENEAVTSAIGKEMPLSNVISLLIQHGCQDVTRMLDLAACSEHPVSSGGFGDIFQGKLKSATVAIKCMRMVIDPYSSEQKKYLKNTEQSAAREIHTWSKLDHRPVSRTDSDGITLGRARSVARVFEKAASA